jgi:hypothetical protein
VIQMSILRITSVFYTCDLHEAFLRLEVVVLQLCKRAWRFTASDEQMVSTYRISPLGVDTKHHQSILSL